MKPENYPTEPAHLWEIFYQFTQTPRPSKEEEKIRNYLIELAEKNNCRYQIDQAGNLIIYVPGKNGRENDEPVIIQNHIDMVTDALHDRKINFSTDPLEVYVEGEWLKANGTTLGADNGIGCAAALATILDQTLTHPPLELLFTVDEETGLHGALGLEHKYLSGKKMLNLDTEEWGSLYIGCAGGIDYEFNGSVTRVPASMKESYKIQVEGFLGGHSGVDIHEQRGNAIKFLGELLKSIEAEIELVEVRGGKAHNIIPRDAFAIIRLENEKLDEVNKHIQRLIERWKSFLPENDLALKAGLTQVEDTQAVLIDTDKQRVINFLGLFPHGVHRYHSLPDKLASMSNNFARILVVNEHFYAQSSLRFFDREEVRSLEWQLQSMGELFNLKAESHSEYPSWKPQKDNPVLDQVQAVYQKLYKEKAEVTAIHAGLECGILRDKIGEIDVVSFGPTIMGAHSPEERVNIPSVGHFWKLFSQVLKEI